MATRYTGTLKLSIRYSDQAGAYSVAITELGDNARFDALRGIRLSPAMQARTAAVSAEAYDAVARAAMSFAGANDEMVYAYAELDGETGEATVRRSA